ncbi:MAG: hypothetical protein VX949_04115 [Planctomycetota bacterium]|nr:hypothetical protein [Planctomycetota bacterium]
MTLLAAVLVMPGVIAAAQQGQGIPAARISKARIGAIEFSVQLPDAPAVVPALPDLTRFGIVEIPGDCILTAPLPTLWSGVLLPPGKHQLSLEIGANHQVRFLVRSLGGGPALRIPLVRGVLDRPGEAMVATLAVVEDAASPRLYLRLQWGILDLSCNGAPVTSVVKELDGWKLQTFQFPSLTALPSHCVLGTIEDLAGDSPVARAVLVTGSGKQPVLRLEDPSRERTAAAQAELTRSIQRSQKRIRRIDGGGEQQQGEREELQRRLDRAIQQRIALEQKLNDFDSGEGTRLLTPAGPTGPGQPGLQVTIESAPSGMMLKVSTSIGSYRFLLDATS